ncbi:protein translocase subunit SecD [Campylobacter vicugnae]|uniref:protein translocase subunit SecD n=1 Tax=Campylobacter vicugnae TaxID=1660076 RepID=UPI003F6AC7C4
MRSRITYRLIIFILALVFGIFFSMPSFTGSQNGQKVSLGLDLQGGLYMLLSVQTDAAITSKIKSIASAIKYDTDKNDILVDRLKADESGISIALLDSDDAKKLDEILSKTTGIEVQKNELNYRILLTPQEKIDTAKYAVDQAVETIRNRLDQFGLAEPTVIKQGEDKILVELPGIKSSADEQRAMDLIAKSAHLQLMAVDEKRQDMAQTMNDDEASAYGDLLLSDARNPRYKYLVNEIPVLDGSMLVDARVAFDNQTNTPIINFTLNAQGASIFADFTGANVGKRLAIVLDDRVYSAPSINERIGGGSGQISGGFSIEEARDIAIALRSGALIAPVNLEEKRSIGPSLGQQSIDQSMVALAVGAILVVLFMILVYGLAGILANIALVVNILILIAVMALFGATLTLPGMAGILLTIGMAVDANVIINERIRELLKEGHNIHTCIQKGYQNAMSAIIDSNLTTLITSAALYAYGTGPVKGFAVTMSIGIAASMLTAILGTHGMFEFLSRRIEKGSTVLWFGYKIKRG